MSILKCMHHTIYRFCTPTLISHHLHWSCSSVTGNSAVVRAKWNKMCIMLCLWDKNLKKELVAIIVMVECIEVLCNCMTFPSAQQLLFRGKNHGDGGHIGNKIVLGLWRVALQYGCRHYGVSMVQHHTQYPCYLLVCCWTYFCLQCMLKILQHAACILFTTRFLLFQLTETRYRNWWCTCLWQLIYI